MMRYVILDECLKDRRHHYYMKDLVDKVNRKLELHDNIPVSERTIRGDLRFMQSREGWEIELEHRFDGRERIYHYADPDFSIMKQPITPTEADQLSKTITMLSRFKGMPNYQWLEEVLVMLRQKFLLDDVEESMVVFAHNEYLTGLDWFEPLLDAITTHQVVELKYHRFWKKAKKRVVHPYQLRQWNNRWFLVAMEERLRPRLPYTVIPLDRIEHVKVLPKVAFVGCDEEDIMEYFDDIVGVSRWPEGEVQTVRLKAEYPAANYIATKPLHATQRVKERGERYVVFQLDVVPNEELVQQLMVYADQCEVLEPLDLREKIRARAEAIGRKNASQ